MLLIVGAVLSGLKATRGSRTSRESTPREALRASSIRIDEHPPFSSSSWFVVTNDYETVG